jgi:hypothetical protein
MWEDRISCLYGEGKELYGVKFDSHHNTNDIHCKRCSMILDLDYYIKINKRRLEKPIDIVILETEEDNDCPFSLKPLSPSGHVINYKKSKVFFENKKECIIVSSVYKNYFQEIVSLNLAKKQQILKEYIKMSFFMVICAIILFL